MMRNQDISVLIVDRALEPEVGKVSGHDLTPLGKHLAKCGYNVTMQPRVTYEVYHVDTLICHPHWRQVARLRWIQNRHPNLPIVIASFAVGEAGKEVVPDVLLDQDGTYYWSGDDPKAIGDFIELKREHIEQRRLQILRKDLLSEMQLHLENKSYL